MNHLYAFTHYNNINKVWHWCRGSRKLIWWFNTFGIIIVDIFPRFGRFWRQIKHSRWHFSCSFLLIFFSCFLSLCQIHSSQQFLFRFCEIKASISVNFKQFFPFEKAVQIFHFFLILFLTWKHLLSTKLCAHPFHELLLLFILKKFVFVSVFCFSLYDVFVGAACSF